MSIKVNINKLTERNLKDLEITLEESKQIIPIYKNINNIIHLPYSYATSLNFKSRKSKEYERVNININFKLRDYQEEILNELLERLNKTGTCILSLYTGAGKSYIAIFIAHLLKFKTLIIVKGVTLMDQWLELIQKTCINSKVQIVLPKTELAIDCDFYIINIVNVFKMGYSFFDSIGMLICDEIHLLCSSVFHKSFYHVYPRYVLGLSATPYRNDEFNKIISLYFGDYKIVRELKSSFDVNVYYTDLVIEYKTRYDVRKHKNIIDWNSVVNYQSNNDKRNIFIINLIKKYNTLNFLVLCKRVNQVNKLVELLKKENEYVTDLTKNKKSFDTEARILVSTIQKCGVGFSHNKLNALLLASDALEYYIQYLGRVFREMNNHPTIFDIVDNLPLLYKHFYSRKAVYVKVGGTINIINVKL